MDDKIMPDNNEEQVRQRLEASPLKEFLDKVSPETVQSHMQGVIKDHVRQQS